MEKYLNRTQMQTILDSRPKGIPLNEAIDMYVKNGWTIEGVNEPKSTVDKAKDVAVGVAKGVGNTVLDTAQLAEGIGKTVQTGLNKVAPQAFSAPAQESALAPVAQVLTPQGEDQELGSKIGTVATILSPAAPLAATKAVKGAKLATSAVKSVANTVKNKATGALTKELDVADIISDPLNKAGRTDLLKMTGKQTKAGETLGVQKEGLMGQVKPIQTKQDLAKIDNVREYITSKDPIEQIANLNKGAADISETIIRPALEANKSFFNPNILNSRLSKVEVPRLFRTDKVLENTYNEVRKMMLESAVKFPKNKIGLYDARIDFDQAVKREFGDVAFDDPKRSVIRRAIQDMRREVNDIIGEDIPDELFKKQLKKQTDIYDAAENIAEKNNNIIDTNALQRWLKANPTKANILKYVVPTAAGTGLLTQ